MTKRLLRKLLLLLSRPLEQIAEKRLARAAQGGSARYWTSHLVSKKVYGSATESLEHFHWRNRQYPGYIELMPVSGASGLSVLDYGCGPGHDLVGFAEFSKPSRLIGVDVSGPALELSRRRLSLHDFEAELIQIDEVNNAIPVESKSIDLVHSSGVLHHVKDLPAALREISRVLKPGGRFQVEVHNYYSIWVHLYVAYILKIKEGKYRETPLLDAFRQSTDGPNCPISHCYVPSDFIDMVSQHGFTGHFLGSSISLFELNLMKERFDAIHSEKLQPEHAEFLYDLYLNDKGLPTYRGSVAGIGAVFEFNKC